MKKNVQIAAGAVLVLTAAAVEAAWFSYLSAVFIAFSGAWAAYMGQGMAFDIARERPESRPWLWATFVCFWLVGVQCGACGRALALAWAGAALSPVVVLAVALPVALAVAGGLIVADGHSTH